MRAIKFLLFAVLAESVLGRAVPVYADFLGVSPTLIELSARPGQVIRGKFSITSNDSVPGQVEIEIKMEDRDLPDRPAEGLSSDWLKLKYPSNFVLSPFQTKTVKYRIRVPDNLSGERIARVFFSISPIGDASDGVGLLMRNGIPIYLTARGTEKANVSVVDNKVSFIEDRALQFTFFLKLDGNVHVRPSGDLVISDGSTEIDRVELEYGFPIFPGQTKDFIAKSKRSWLPGEYNAQLTIHFGETWGESLKTTVAYKLVVSQDGAQLTEVGHVP